MAKADVLALAQDIGKFGDPISIEDYYDEIVRELGLLELLVDPVSIGITSELSVYQMPIPVIRTLELISERYGTLDRVDRVTLRAVHGTGWTNLKGTPVSFTQELENDNAFRLVPIPDQAESLIGLVSAVRDDVPYWLELPIALEIVFREYTRESQFQNVEFAQAAGQLAQLFFSLVGVFRDIEGVGEQP